ncbi:MAG: hypothetical protein A2X18_04975 [Bacteroidetes bacterium GWF2_40_14]|nr:MAG: hypothetical protein A2X18_04975 [Bacteroidetes bacterium GWF2_40_14]
MWQKEKFKYSDSEVIGQLSEESEVHSLFRSFYSSLMSFSNKFVANMAVSEDIVQDVFVSMWENRENLHTINSIKSFLYASVRNSCINYLKHQKVEQKYLNNYDDIYSEEFFQNQIIEEETDRLIYKVIGSLAPQTRKILVYNLAGYSNPEISIKLGISVNTVKTLKSRAYKILKRNLAENFDRETLKHILGIFL